jgi:pSer/pThr/pTyr-binding forkhead associated (FHA) protein
MRDGRTRKLRSKKITANDIRDFLSRYSAAVVVLSGPAAGQEIVLDRERTILGRGPGVDVEFDDETMSRQHAAIEYANSRFKIRDLGSTNGIKVNDRMVQAGDLEHGDQFTLGALRFQFVIDEVESVEDVYELPTGA